MRLVATCVLTLALLGTVRADGPAEAKSAKSRIVAVGLFKNGLAVVKREVTISGPGTYQVEDVPEPVHGTFWVDCSAPVDTALRWREVEEPARPLTANPWADVSDKLLHIRIRGDKDFSITGRAVGRAGPAGDAGAAREGEPSGRFLVVQTNRGRVLVDTNEIAAIEIEGQDGPVKRRKAVLVLTVGQANPPAAKLHVTYLTQGISWAPSYRVDVSDPKSMAIEQSAAIRNELADLDRAEVTLISGFPSVQMAQVQSPLAPRMQWSTFLSQLSRGGGIDNSPAAQPAAPMMAHYGPIHNWAEQLAERQGGDEGVDLHYQAVGPRTMALGEGLSVSVAKKETPYERIIDWVIPDNRDEFGNSLGNLPSAGDAPDLPWDALKFKNPFSFPMTAGPIMVAANGHFNGQRLSYWVNTGEETTLRVNKALSVRTLHTEQEVAPKEGPSDRDLVLIGGRRFRKVSVEGELTAGNLRKEAVRLVIRRRFSGELLQAVGDPKKQLREEGVYAVNKRNELVWTLPLGPGEEKKLTYRYSVLVAHEQRIPGGFGPVMPVP
jgi:hypothetical protein